MMRWYRAYLTLLDKTATSRWPATHFLVLLFAASAIWTGYWLFAEQRVGGEILLPLLTSLWLLMWLFVRFVFHFKAPALPDNPNFSAKLRQCWFQIKRQGTACFILGLTMICMLISLKLATVIWRSFG